MLSVIIITKNEEKMLPDALKSVMWVDEVLVVDTGSEDKTIQIAKKVNARVEISKGKTFADWRTDALKYAKGDWVLYLDADERITSTLRKEIEKTIENDTLFAYAIPRTNFVFGKEMKYTGFTPDYVKRLFKKKYLQKWTGDLHEEPVFKGELGHLQKPMLHLKHESLHEMVEKTNKWSEIEGRLMFEAHHPPMNIPRFLSAMFREFWLRMIRQTAFLDGKEGLIYAMYQVYSRFVSYAKLWELQERERMRVNK
jgi:glycosyltransferase involved in cell wall biosynthesis